MVAKPRHVRRTSGTSRQPGRAPSRVVIASDSDETLDGLQSYLMGAGLIVRALRRLDRAEIESDEVAAVVLFADDFATDDVVDVVAGLAERRADLLPLLVSGDPKRLDALVKNANAGATPVVIPKPAWGSTILDTIRTRLKA